MFIPITPLLRQNKKKKLLFLIVSFFFLSAFPIYKNYVNGEAITTYEIFRGIIEKKAKFYNPWQYRILCPLLIEVTKKTYDHTIDRILPIEKVIHFKFDETSGFTPETQRFIHELNDPQTVKYLIIFIAFRFIEDFLILLFSFYFLSYFIKNRWLVLLGLVMVSWSMGNGVNVSDLAFNTYLDIVLYLLAACIILYQRNPWYIVPIAIIGSLNRETSLLIPFLFFVSRIKFDTSSFLLGIFNKTIWPPKKDFIISAVASLSFIIIFIGLRIYFGYRPQTVWKVPAGLPMLKLNLVSFVAIKGYFEMFGAFSILPLICLYKFKQCSLILRIWFVAIVPIWFFVHFYSVVTYQSRTFLVPTFLIFLPMVLEIIQKNAGLGNKSENRNSVSIK